jgi:hypothetical protein
VAGLTTNLVMRKHIALNQGCYDFLTNDTVEGKILC